MKSTQFLKKINRARVLMGILILVILIFLLYRESTSTFTREKWMSMNYKEYGHPARELRRIGIYKDLLKRYKFKGRRSYLARYLLGNPDLRKRTGNSAKWIYEIDREYAGDMDLIRTKDLVISMDVDTVNNSSIIRNVYVSDWFRDDY